MGPFSLANDGMAITNECRVRVCVRDETKFVYYERQTSEERLL